MAPIDLEFLTEPEPKAQFATEDVPMLNKRFRDIHRD